MSRRRSSSRPRGTSGPSVWWAPRAMTSSSASTGFRGRLAVVVDLGLVVEHHQALGRVCGEREFDGVGEVVDAGEDRDGLGLDEDRVQLLDRGAGLQRDGDGSGQG